MALQAKTLNLSSQTIAYYESSGKGPAVLFVHGNSLSAQTFKHQLESPLGERYRFIAIDLPGHGRSGKARDPESSYTLPGYANLIAAFAEKLQLENAAFVGWSLGGHILLEAADRLSKTGRFMIYGTPPLGIPPAMEEAFLPHPAMANLLKSELTEDEVATFAEALIRPDAAETSETFREDIRCTDRCAREILGANIGQGKYKDEIEVVANLKAPLAILHGEEDPLVNSYYFNKLKMPTLWRGEIQVIPHAGHAPHWEQPELFNTLLEEFLTETSGQQMQLQV